MTQKKTVPFTPLQQAAIDSFQAGAEMKRINERISQLVDFCLTQQEAETGYAAENTHLGHLIAAKRQAGTNDSVLGEQQAVDGCKHCSAIIGLLDQRKSLSRKRAGARIRLNNIAKQLLAGQMAEGDGNV